jgi:hypothetical protein
MKSCIFQKQEPVDIPQVETRTLEDVLELPWGFEIYSLLTRWNPLNFARRARARHGIQGAGGRAGSGGIHAGASSDERRPHGGRVDGLKIEPLPPEFRASTPHGERVPFRPIRDIERALRIARRPRDGGLRRRGRIRHHGALEQEFPER